MVYVIHFDEVLSSGTSALKSRHYIGYVDESRGAGLGALARRMEQHATGRGAKIMAEVARRGLGWRLVAVYRGERTDERRLKNQRNAARFCPVCKMERPGLTLNDETKARINPRSLLRFLTAIDMQEVYQVVKRYESGGYE